MKTVQHFPMNVHICVKKLLAAPFNYVIGEEENLVFQPASLKTKIVRCDLKSLNHVAQKCLAPVASVFFSSGICEMMIPTLLFIQRP